MKTDRVDQGTEGVGVTMPDDAPGTSEPQRSRIARMVRNRGWVTLLPGIVLLTAWELASGRLVREIYLSRPTDVLERLIQMFRTGEVWPDIAVTAQELGYAYAIGLLSGTVVGYALGRSPALSRVFEPYILAFYGVPKIALAPLFIIWFGIDLWSKVALAAFMVFFIVFFNVYMGVRSVDQDYVDIARIMGADQRVLTQSIFLPAAMPHILIGFRAALPYGVIGVVVGEFMAARQGIGLYMYRSSTTYDPAGVFAGIIILLTFILVAGSLLSAAEQRLLKWQPNRTRTGTGQ